MKGSIVLNALYFYYTYKIESEIIEAKLSYLTLRFGLFF